MLLFWKLPMATTLSPMGRTLLWVSPTWRFHNFQMRSYREHGWSIWFLLVSQIISSFPWGMDPNNECFSQIHTGVVPWCKLQEDRSPLPRNAHQTRWRSPVIHQISDEGKEGTPVVHVHSFRARRGWKYHQMVCCCTIRRRGWYGKKGPSWIKYSRIRALIIEKLNRPLLRWKASFWLWQFSLKFSAKPRRKSTGCSASHLSLQWPIERGFPTSTQLRRRPSGGIQLPISVFLTGPMRTTW